MILVDFSQVCIGSIMLQTGGKPQNLNDDLVRHMILNTLRSFTVRFKAEYGEIVICCDSRRYWRQEYFPHYKHNRKKERERSGFNWDEIHRLLDLVKAELKEFYPHRVLEVDGAEADDIIGVLTRANAPYLKKILILSTDKDFLQLQKFNTVSQFNNITGKFLVEKDPERFLAEHILRGDPGDGIPNVLSPADTIVNPAARQKPLNKRKIEALLDMDNEAKLTPEQLFRYVQNLELIDLSHIPTEVASDIMNAYDSYQIPARTKLLEYFRHKKLNNLIGAIGDF